MSGWTISISCEPSEPDEPHHRTYGAYGTRRDAETAAREKVQAICEKAPSKIVTVAVYPDDLTRHFGQESAELVVLGHWHPDRGWVAGVPAPAS